MASVAPAGTDNDAGYPPTAFAFAVTIVKASAVGAVAGLAIDAAFREVSGIDPAVETEDVAEGGVNDHVHRLPGVTKHGNLVLKRGVVVQPSGFAEWATDTVGSTLAKAITTQQIVVSLLGIGDTVLASWQFNDAWPVKWETGGFDALRNEVLIETLEIAYSTVTRQDQGSS